MSKVIHVLVLCHGNVNRSQAAHAVLEQLGRDADLGCEFEVRSAGVKTVDGRIAAKKCREIMGMHGYNMEGRRSRVLLKSDVDWATHILYMDKANKSRFEAAYGAGVGLSPDYIARTAAKLRSLGAYIDQAKIADPAFMQRGSPEEAQVFVDIIAAAHKFFEKEVME